MRRKSHIAFRAGGCSKYAKDIAASLPKPINVLMRLTIVSRPAIARALYTRQSKHGARDANCHDNDGGSYRPKSVRMQLGTHYEAAS